MKSLLIHCFVYLTAFLAVICGPEEDPPISINASVPNTISVDNQSREYSINDTLWINVSIPVTVLDSNNEQIDLFEITNNQNIIADFFFFNQGPSSDSESSIVIDENDIVPEDEVIPYDNGRIVSLLTNLTQDNYSGRFGIKLKESGSFYFKVGFNEEVTFNIDGPNTGDLYYSIFITSNIEGEDELGRYNFVVTDTP